MKSVCDKIANMTLTIEIAPETEILLQTEARRKGLSPNLFVQRVLEEKLSKRKNKNRTMPGILREMLAEGMISRIPEGITAEKDDFVPIKINGRPLSETILEDRD